MKRLRAEVLNVRRAGIYVVVTLVAPEIAGAAKPGQFVSVAGPEDRAIFLRRPFSVSQASRRGGWAGTLEFVADPRVPGDGWVADLRAHDTIDVIGPLGTPFAFPAKRSSCLLVCEGLGAPIMYFLAQELRGQGKRVDLVVGGGTSEEIFKALEAKRVAAQVTLATVDGTIGERGATLDFLAPMVEQCGSEVVYAAGPRALLRGVAEFCAERAIPAQFAVHEEMACGTGLCFTCVVPVIRRDGSGYDNLRACTDGPVLNPARILWDRWMGEQPATLPTPPGGFPAPRAWPE